MDYFIPFQILGPEDGDSSQVGKSYGASQTDMSRACIELIKSKVLDRI